MLLQIILNTLRWVKKKLHFILTLISKQLLLHKNTRHILIFVSFSPSFILSDIPLKVQILHCSEVFNNFDPVVSVSVTNEIVYNNFFQCANVASSPTLESSVTTFEFFDVSDLSTFQFLICNTGSLSVNTY